MRDLSPLAPSFIRRVLFLHIAMPPGTQRAGRGALSVLKHAAHICGRVSFQG